MVHGRRKPTATGLGGCWTVRQVGASISHRPGRHNARPGAGCAITNPVLPAPYRPSNPHPPLRHYRDIGDPGEGPQVGGNCLTFTTSPSTGSYAKVSEGGNPRGHAGRGRAGHPPHPPVPSVRCPFEYIRASISSTRQTSPGGRHAPRIKQSNRPLSARDPSSFTFPRKKVTDNQPGVNNQTNSLGKTSWRRL